MCSSVHPAAVVAVVDAVVEMAVGIAALKDVGVEWVVEMADGIAALGVVEAVVGIAVLRDAVVAAAVFRVVALAAGRASLARYFRCCPRSS